MLRRLLTCLALLTGLAAISAPAHANLIDALNAQLELTQKADDAEKAEVVSCAERQRQQRLRGVRVTSCRSSEPVTIYVPTVQFGSDRAFE